MSEDDELFAEIAAQADNASDNAPTVIDLKALATALSRRFTHRSVDEIEEELEAVWRARGLFLAD